MGSVFRVLDRELGYEVALKRLHGVTGQDRLALKREFRALTHIVHPNLVALHDLVVDEDHCFFTMELVTGRDFVEHFRHLRDAADPSTFDTELRDAARQLALAVNALHEGGALHRDIKPSNALIADSGRVVLLDFGLVVTSTDPTKASGREFAGTVEYASPEQVWGEAVTRASDWYSFGVSLYEAVSGRLPVEAPVHEIAYLKKHHTPASLVDLGHSLDSELDALISALLRPNPDERPEAERVLSCLGGQVSGRTSSLPRPTRPSGPLVGRERELAQLSLAFEFVREGRTLWFELSGTSGIGKSSLVRAFTQPLASDDRAFVLCSRCHPAEALAFNAVDGLVDDLARAPELPALVASMSDESARALSRLFPALTPRLARPSPGGTEQALRATHDARQLAFSALRFLFEGLSRTRPLVLWIDDLQWADEDSGTLLRELLRPPGYGLLAIACYRAEDREQSACLRVLDDESSARLDVPRRVLSLGPLDASSGLELVRESSGARVSAEDPALGALLESTEGSPFLLQEVALFLKTQDPERPLGSVSLDDLLRLRTKALPDAARKVLEVFAIAGAPLEQDVALRAAGLAPRDRGAVSDLERLSVLRTTAVRGRVSEIYHHRIREEVIRQLERPARLQRHRDIGNAVLASASPNPLLAVDHFEAAEDLDLLRRYIVPAANHAFNGLAFERAARLYERAGALGASDMLPHELRTRRAASLSNAGRGHEAALAFQEARAALASHAEADLEQHLGLAKNAADHFIQSGRYAEGLAVLREVMDALEIPLPRSRGRALLDATLLRFAMVARGVRLPPSRATAPSARELLRFDTLWSTSIRVSMIDYALSSYGVARCAVDALALGEPSRMACALALEATNLATLPLPLFGRRANELFALAERLLESEKTTGYDRAFLLASYGVTACFRSDFAACVRFVDQARTLLEELGEVHHYEFALWQTWAMIGLSHLGEIKEVKKRAEALRKIGSERGDRFALQMTDLGRPSLAWLAEDRAEYALEQANRALSWAPSDYNTQHYWHFTTTIECKLYLGDFEGAWSHAEAAWPAQQKNHFLKVIFAREELWLGRARAALGQAALLSKGGASRPGAPKRAKSYLDLARSCARQIDRAGLRAGQGWAQLLEAVAAHLSGDDARARAQLTTAIRLFDAAGMQLYREASRYCLGMLEGDFASVERARTWMSNQGILVPEAMVRMMAPGMPGTTPPAKP